MNTNSEITKKDLRRAWFRWWTFAEVSHSFERLQAVAFCNAMTPILRKLYQDSDELKRAILRHLQFFNTQANWGGGFILGTTIALEEQRSNALQEGVDEKDDVDIITSTKVGLMGPLAGIGDSIDWGTLRYMLIALAIPWAQDGLWIGGVFPIVTFVIMSYAYGYLFASKSYSIGRESAVRFLRDDKVGKMIEGASVLGLFMMGVLAAKYVNVQAALEWTIGGKVWGLDSILNSILPGVLPFLAIALTYLYFDKKGLKVMNALMWMMVISFTLGVAGVL